jgi:hypothetical protein
MHTSAFDGLARTLVRAASRRTTLGALLAMLDRIARS